MKPFYLALLGICLVLFIFLFFTMKKEHMSNIKIINYNTEWCGYSKKFKPIWDEFTQIMKVKHPNIEVIDMKCDISKNKNNCKIPEVEGFPTVILFNGNNKKVFEDNRTVDDLLKFVEQ
jgi:hypothetical protein